jgi:hypothetical protein
MSKSDDPNLSRLFAEYAKIREITKRESVDFKTQWEGSVREREVLESRLRDALLQVETLRVERDTLLSESHILSTEVNKLRVALRVLRDEMAGSPDGVIYLGAVWFADLLRLHGLDPEKL